MIESCCAVLRYVADVVHALIGTTTAAAVTSGGAGSAPSSLVGPSGARASSPPWEGEVVIPNDPDVDWIDDLTHDDDDDSVGDESVRLLILFQT